ncbi:MAG: NAD-dependent epimerase/dehydratase family protein [Acidobacteriota bacterium]
MTLQAPITCVTGGTGFIGSAVTRRLIDDGHRVRVLSRRDTIRDERAEHCRGSLDDAESLQRFLSGGSLLVHIAGETRDEGLMWDVNVMGTRRLVDAARQAGIRRMCHMSTSIVTGPAGDVLLTEEAECRPVTPYQRSKWAAEMDVINGMGDCRLTVLRPTHVVGPSRPGPFVYPARGSWLDRLRILVNGAACAHVISIVDVVDAAVFLIGSAKPSPVCYIISCDEDPMNTFSGLWTLYLAARRGAYPLPQAPVAHLPLRASRLAQRLRGRNSLHPGQRYSSRRLRHTGFAFSHGVAGAARLVAACGQWVCP